MDLRGVQLSPSSGSETLWESSLFSATAARNDELRHVFGVSGEALLELAVNHELGHSVCHDQDERKANEYGRELRLTKTVDCAKTLDGLSKIYSAFRSPQARRSATSPRYNQEVGRFGVTRELSAYRRVHT